MAIPCLLRLGAGAALLAAAAVVGTLAAVALGDAAHRCGPPLPASDTCREARRIGLVSGGATALLLGGAVLLLPRRAQP